MYIMSIENIEQNAYSSSFSLTESYLRRAKFVFKYKFKLIKFFHKYNKSYWKKHKSIMYEEFKQIINIPYEKTIKKTYKEIWLEEEKKNSGAKRGVLEINNTCNIDCIMCRTSLATKKKGRISEETLQVALKRLKDDGVNYVSMHTIGDPLANPKLEIIFKELRKYKIKCGVSTNGLLLYKHIKILQKYVDVCPSIKFSIDGATKKTYEKIRNKGKWDDLIKNLDLSNKYLKKYNIPIRINMTVSKDNCDEIGEFICLYKKYVNAPSKDMPFHLVNSLSPDNSYFHSMNLFPNYTRKKYMCEAVLANNPLLTWDGRVSICGRDYSGELEIGDYKKTSLKNIREKSKYLKYVQKSHEKKNLKKLPFCNTCYHVDPRLNTFFNMFIQYIIYKNKDMHAAFYQNKHNDLIYLFQKKIPNEEKLKKIIEN